MTVEEELAQLKRSVQTINDRQQILDCITRESRGRDRHDSEQIASCWWDDGVDEHGAYLHPATLYPARANAGHRANFHMTSHNITNHLCELNGDIAYCESYVMGGLSWLDKNVTTIALGRYIDQLERRNGEWRIRTRRCTIEMTADCDGSWVHSASVEGFLKGLWSKDDPSYERPIVAKPKAEGVRW